MNSKKRDLEFSIIIPVIERCDDLVNIYKEYSAEVKKISSQYEFIFIFNFSFVKEFNQINEFKKCENLEDIKIIRFGRDFSESIALDAGFSLAKGKYVFTLAAYFQVEPEHFISIVDELNKGYDMVITHRYPRKDPFFNRVQSKLFHFLSAKMVDFKLHDISCSFRGMKAEVTETIAMTGDLHRFLPILAHKYGYTIKEIDVKQRVEDRKLRLFSINTYVSRIIDIISLFFIVKFTRKPLRFFGIVGAVVFAFAIMVALLLIYEKIFLGAPISDQPLLLVELVLLIVGIQTISLGLVGELIIFVNARDIKEYTIEKIIK